MIRSVDRVCDLLDLLQDVPEGVTLQDAARAARLPKSSAFRYLTSLEARRYAQRDPRTGRYQLGSAFIPTRTHQVDLLVERAHPQLERIRDEIGETASLGLLDGDHVAFLDVVESPQELRVAPDAVGPLHATAAGKAIATQLSRQRMHSVLAAAGMQVMTEQTITDEQRFAEEVAVVGVRGYAVDDGERTEGSRAVAVAMPGTYLPAALTINAPADRLPLESAPKLARLLSQAAARITGAVAALTSAIFAASSTWM